jgi:hypothetical protein
LAHGHFLVDLIVFDQQHSGTASPGRIE